MRWWKGWVPLHLCPAEKRAAVVVLSGSLTPSCIHPHAPKPTQLPDLPATEGTHVRIPFLIMLQRALIGPPLGLPATTKTNSVGWEKMDWTLPSCRHVFLFLFFSKESGGGGMEMGRGLGGGFSNISLLRGCLVNP